MFERKRVNLILHKTYFAVVTGRFAKNKTMYKIKFACSQLISGLFNTLNKKDANLKFSVLFIFYHYSPESALKTEKSNNKEKRSVLSRGFGMTDVGIR